MEREGKKEGSEWVEMKLDIEKIREKKPKEKKRTAEKRKESERFDWNESENR